MVVLPLRDAAAHDLTERLLSSIDDALLLTLPGLSEVVVETPEGVRTLRRSEADGYVRVEDSTSGSAGDSTAGSASGAHRWRTVSHGGPLDPELLRDRPVEERLRPHWSVTWAVPVDDEEPALPADHPRRARPDPYGRTPGHPRPPHRLPAARHRPPPSGARAAHRLPGAAGGRRVRRTPRGLAAGDDRRARPRARPARQGPARRGAARGDPRPAAARRVPGARRPDRGAARAPPDRGGGRGGARARRP